MNAPHILKQAPASIVQQGLHFIQEIQPDSCAYNLVLSSRVLAVESAEVLVASIEQAINSECALRCRFQKQDEHLELVFDPDLMHRVHISHTESDDVASLQALAASLAQRPFDLQRGPGVRADLVKTSDRDYLLVLVVHHALLDFWSLALLLERIGNIYSEAITTNQIPCGPQATSFSYLNDLSLMAASRSNRASMQTARSFWQSTLPQSPDALAFPTDFPRPANYRYRGKAISFAYSSAETAAIQAWCREHAVTPYQFFMTVFQQSLHRYTGQSRVLVATPIAGRNRQQMQRIGNYVTSILMVNDFSPTTDFSEALQRTVKHQRAVMKHSHYTLPDIVSQLVGKRDLSRTPLVQAAFSWDKVPAMAPVQSLFVENAPQQAINYGSLTLAPCYTHQQLGQFEWALEMGSEIEGTWHGVLKYSDDLYREATARQLCDWIRAEALAIVGYQPIARHLLSQVPARTYQPSPTSQIHGDTVLHMFSHQARRNAAKTAVIDEDKLLDYQTVSLLAASFARQLRPLVVPGNCRIGVSVRKNRWVVPLLLGVMQAGAAYVPIDPAFPDARRALIEEKARLTALITDDASISAADESCLTLELSDLLQAPLSDRTQPAAEVRPTDSAYILFTSGSTGTPKGVEISHHALANFLRAMQQEPGLNEHDVLLSVTTISFDISILELFGPLVTGATVAIADMDTVRNATQLDTFFRRIQPTVMQATPASWKMLIQSGWQGDGALKILSGGEPLPPSLADDLLARGNELWNMYGPTETTIWSTCQKVEAQQPICLGRPLINTPLFVLDHELQPVPRGAIGELFIGGPGLSKGYFEAPDLTAAAFIQHRSGEGRIYKTGDLVRLDSNGDLHYVARKDDQIKLNGYRIELGDINEHLLRLEAIDDAVTVLRNADSGACLVSYYVAPASLESADIEADIRRHLKAQLPGYMVPSVLVRLDALPYTSNKKVDRKQLPEPLQARRDPALIVEPRDTFELVICTLFREVLALESISVDDDFFALGGTSVSAVTVVARINEYFGVDHPADLVLRNSSVEALAATLRDCENQASDHVLIPMHRNPGKPKLFLVHPIGGTLYCYLKLNQSIRESYEIFGLQSPGLNDGDQSLVTVEDMATLFSERISAAAEGQPVYLAGWCFGGVLCYELSEQLRRRGDTVMHTFMFDSRAPIEANHPENGDDAMLLSWFARDLAVPQGKTLLIDPDSLRGLDDDSMFSEVFAQLTATGVLPPDSKPSAIRHLFEVYLANAIALQMYLPGRYDNEYLLLKARDELPDWGEYLGWEQVLGAAPPMQLVAGDHNTMMFEPHVEEIGRLLCAQANTPTPAGDSRRTLRG